MSFPKQVSRFYFPMEFNEEFESYNPTNWHSLFIPFIDDLLADEDILSFLVQEVFRLGSVKKVDLIKMNNVSMAFIHFHHWFKNNSSLLFRAKMDKDKTVDIYGYVDHAKKNTDFCSLINHKISKNAFLRFLIYETFQMNPISLLTHVLEHFEQKINDKNARIEELCLQLLEKNIILQNIYFQIKDFQQNTIPKQNIIQTIYNNLHSYVADTEDDDFVSVME